MAKVLIMRFSSLGDVAMLVPVVASVASRYPQDRFTVMTRSAFVPLFQNLGFNISVVAIDMRGKHKGVLGIFRIIGKAMGYSRIADEHDVLRTKIVRWTLRLTGKKVACIDKGREEKKHAIATKEVVPPLKSSIVRYFEVFDRLGFPAKETFSGFFDFSPRVYTDLKSIVMGEKTGVWIGIAPFSKHKGKIYPLHRMHLLIEELVKRGNVTIFLFGSGKDEKRILERWVQGRPNVINMAGRAKLGKEILLISYLDVMVSMDSGNMHLASLVNVPVVSVWGATHPGLGFYGFRQDPANAVQVDLPCRPCSVYGDVPCVNPQKYACMEGISEEMILNRIDKILKQQTT